MFCFDTIPQRARGGQLGATKRPQNENSRCPPVPRLALLRRGSLLAWPSWQGFSILSASQQFHYRGLPRSLHRAIRQESGRTCRTQVDSRSAGVCGQQLASKINALKPAINPSWMIFGCQSGLTENLSHACFKFVEGKKSQRLLLSSWPKA